MELLLKSCDTLVILAGVEGVIVLVSGVIHARYHLDEFLGNIRKQYDVLDNPSYTLWSRI